MTHVAIFFSHPEPEGPPFDNPGYRSAYRELARRISVRGPLCTFVRGKGTFMGAGTFTRGWRFDAAGGLCGIEEHVEADVVYNKGEDFTADGATRLINHPELDALCRNKDRTYDAFTRFMPETVLIQNNDELLQHLRGADPKRRIVLKPTNRWGGRGVTIGFPKDIAGGRHSHPLLLQALVDTSGGIPGLCGGVHDLRCVLVNGEIVTSSVRTPLEGSLIVRVAQGADVRLLEQKETPEEPQRIAREADRIFARFGTRIYSVDCGRDVSGRWYIIEINPQPGLTAPHRSPQTAILYGAIANALVGHAAPGGRTVAQ